jgi:hypothetical protein
MDIISAYSASVAIISEYKSSLLSHNEKYPKSALTKGLLSEKAYTALSTLNPPLFIIHFY